MKVYSSAETSTRSVHILIVEANLAIQDLLIHLLRLKGYGVTATINDQEALLCIDEMFPQDYYSALILLDISLPKGEGVLLFHRFCDHLQQKYLCLPPIIVLTTYDCYGDLEVEQVITKPFHIKSLLSAIEQTVLHCLCKEQAGEKK